MEKIKSTLLLLIGLIITVSCNDNDPEPENYAWTPTATIPYFDVIHKFKIADGNSLFIAGTVGGTPGIFKLKNNKWIKLVETHGFADDFSIYKGVLYYGSYYGLYRVANSTSEKFTTNDPHILAMEVYDDKLFITGDSILIDGNYYSTASFDGYVFSPVSEYYAGYSMHVANNKLYISSYPVQEYDVDGLLGIEIGGQSNITHDNSGNVYVASIGTDSKGKTFSVIQKYDSKKGTMLGDTLKCHVSNIQAFDNTIIVTGSTSEGVSYYYSDNRWKQIDIPYPTIGGTNIIGDMIVYDNKLLASQLISGSVLELK